MIKGPKWNDKYSVHVEEIDEQHKKLFEIINKTIDVYEARSDNLLDVLKELVDYVGYHFNTELQYMAEYDYPGYGDHNKEHTLFTQKVVEFLDKVDVDQNALVREMIIFMKDWYVNHVLNTDQKMGKFLAEEMAKQD